MSSTVVSTGSPVYFFREYEHPYGFLSQWFEASFTAPVPHKLGPTMTFNCTEQYMMFHKAILFNDSDIADQIMHVTTPKKQKALGRKIKNFDGMAWDAQKEQIVEDGNWNKFCNSKKGTKLKDMLVQTGDRELVEVEAACKEFSTLLTDKFQASPFDRWANLDRFDVRLTVST
ncbi:MAG: hypothetical protein Q9183_000414 [Haloplaca sp. 2 TL-2023]